LAILSNFIEIKKYNKIKSNNKMESQPEKITTQENKQPEQNAPTQSEGKSITEYVKADVVTQLMEMGFSKAVSEKACFFTQSILEKALEWIEEHQKDPDFEEELRIVGEQENKPKMTEEEVKQKAKELQELARRRYIQKQKELEEEQERNRIRQSKICFNKFFS
jgi:uncharacterized UBP type Zn finger protein